MNRFKYILSVIVSMSLLVVSIIWFVMILGSGEPLPDDEVSMLVAESEMRQQALTDAYLTEREEFIVRATEPLCTSLVESVEDYSETEEAAETLPEITQETEVDVTMATSEIVETTIVPPSPIATTEEDYEHDITDFHYYCKWSADWMTPDEFDLLCKVVYAEVGTECYDTKYMVALTILNRSASNLFPESVYDVVFQDGQYAVATDDAIFLVAPDEETINACMMALETNDHPTDMYYFRSSHYFSFGQPYMNLGNVYFSLQD